MWYFRGAPLELPPVGPGMESLRMMMLSSSGGPRRPQLRSPKSFRAISSSCEVLGAASSSSEDRSTTNNPLEGLPCSYIGGSSPWNKTSGEEDGGGEDQVGEGGGIEASLD
jgi:hypothetical protein